VRQLAAQLGISAHSHIAKIETGQSRPSTDLVLKIARFFEVSIDVLMKDELDLE
jgi:transcriptional regulator with XRE-family HTH domain